MRLSARAIDRLFDFVARTIGGLRKEWAATYREGKLTGGGVLLPDLTGGGDPFANRWGKWSSLGTVGVVLVAWAAVPILGLAYGIGTPNDVSNRADPGRTPRPASLPEDPSAFDSLTTSARGNRGGSDLGEVLQKTGELIETRSITATQGVAIVKEAVAQPGVSRELILAAGKAGIDLGADALRKVTLETPRHAANWFKNLGTKVADAGIRVGEDGLKQWIEAALRPEPLNEKPHDPAPPNAGEVANVVGDLIVNCAPAAVAIPRIKTVPSAIPATNECRCPQVSPSQTATSAASAAMR